MVSRIVLYTEEKNEIEFRKQYCFLNIDKWLVIK